MKLFSKKWKWGSVWDNFSITVRIISLIMLPVVLMLGMIVAFTYYTRLAEVNEELSERGHIIANALAASSEYAIISGNMVDLNRVAQSLVEADNSIAQIDLVDTNQQLLLHVVAKEKQTTEQRVFEVPIFNNPLFVDNFFEDGIPHVSALSIPASQPLADKMIGHVIVKMSPANLIVKQKNRFYIAVVMVLLALIASIPLVILLSRSLISQLTTAIGALKTIRTGNYETRVAITTGGEIGDLQLSINEMAASLAESKSELENKVKLRTQELEDSRNQALKSDAEKRRLIQKMNSIVEEERKHISSEIHDELNSALVATQLNAQIIVGLVAKSEPTASSQQIKEKAQTIISQVATLYSSARTLVRRLRPELLDTLGLHGAIEEIVKNFEEVHPKCRFDFYSNASQIELDSELEITIYRLVQEALSNSIKHASATRTEVTLNRVEGFVQIIISDNGIGFDPAHVAGGMGIVGMKERVYAFNGDIKFASNRVQGTKVIITFPTGSLGKK